MEDVVNFYQGSYITETNVHIRIQNRNGKKCITTIQGLANDLDLNRITKTLKKTFKCSGTIIEDVIQIQGDQRNNIVDFLVSENIVSKERIIIHGA